jgi:PAS fold
MTPSDIASLDLKFAVSGNPIRRLILSGAALVAAIAFGTAIMAGNFRERALNDSERELGNTVLLLAHHFDQQFEEFEVVQKDLVTYMRSTGISSSEGFKRQMSTQDTHEMLKSKSNGSSDVAGVNIFDAGGTLINSSTWPLPAVNVADRAYFKAFKSGTASTPVLIELLKSRLAGGGWTALISRAITGPNNEFLGLVTRGIATASFEKFFEPLALGDDAVISMFHHDGTMMARYPHVEKLIGQDFSKSPFFEVISTTSHGSARKKSGVDGTDRLGAVRELSNFPIVIVATTSVASALADWRDQTRLLIGVAGLIVLVIVVMLFLIVRQLARQHRLSQHRLSVEKRRLDIAVNNMAQGLLLFDSSQRLVIYNQRYIDMLGGSPDVVKPGCTIHDLLAHRKDTGSFEGDVDEHCLTL